MNIMKLNICNQFCLSFLLIVVIFLEFESYVTSNYLTPEYLDNENSINVVTTVNQKIFIVIMVLLTF